MSRDYYRVIPVATGLLAFSTDLISRAYLGVSPGDVSPLRAAAGSPRVPILLIHGEADSFIPIAHFEGIKEGLRNRPGVDYWTIEGADHGSTFAMEREAYETRVLAFFGQHLRGVNAPFARDGCSGRTMG